MNMVASFFFPLSFFFFNGSTIILSYRWYRVLYCSSSSKKKKDKSYRISCIYFLLLVAVVKDTLSFFINTHIWTCLTHFILCVPFTTPSACSYLCSLSLLACMDSVCDIRFTWISIDGSHFLCHHLTHLSRCLIWRNFKSQRTWQNVCNTNWSFQPFIMLSWSIFGLSYGLVTYFGSGTKKEKKKKKSKLNTGLK